jgi:hypothetical protein
MSALPDPLARTLRAYCNVDALDLDGLRSYLASAKGREQADEFKAQLAAAIEGKILTPAEYERLTGEDFDSPEDLKKWLVQLWRELFGTTPPA